MTALEELKALKELGAVPIDMGTLKNIFHEYQSPEKKVQALEQAGKLMKVKRDLYIRRILWWGQVA